MEKDLRFKELSETLKVTTFHKMVRLLLSVYISKEKVGGMRSMWRTLLACILCGLVGLVNWSAVARAEAAFVAGSGSSVFSSSMVVSESPEEAQQIQDEREAKLASPEAVAAREESRTAYTDLTSPQVAELLGDTFPSLIKHRAGAPELPEGSRIISDLSDNAAQVVLPGGQVGVFESLQRIAVQSSPGHFAPIDLALSSAEEGYVPVRSDVAVQIPSDLSSGVKTPWDGISLTPVDSQGSPLSGSQGTVDGSTVVYTNTGIASDTLVKPTPSGFQIDAVLRSSESSQQLFYKVGMGSGASLVQDPGSGIVSVVLNGAVLAVILPPSAMDAAGSPVPTTMSVSKDTITVTVDHSSGSWLYPIEVDPEFSDNQLVENGGKRSNWEFTGNAAKFGHNAKYEGVGKEKLETTGIAEYGETEKAYWAYQTRGNSKIYEVKASTEGKNAGAQIESFLELESTGGSENKYTLSSEFSKPEYGNEVAPAFCAKNGTKVECVPAAGAAGNVVRFQQSVQKKPTNYKFYDALTQGIVYLSEPAGSHSTTGFNTTSPELEGVIEVEGKKEGVKRVNILHSGGWLTKSSGAAEFTSEDKGIGVSASRLEYENSPGKWEQLSEHKYLENEHLCKGVQCEAQQREFWILNPKLPNGEDKLRYRAEDAMPGTASLESEGITTVKVDTAQPHGLAVVGLPWGNELSERVYTLKAEAIDGEGTSVASSGIKSISLYVDGNARTETGHQVGCFVPKGECKAKAEWQINGSELGAGHHAIDIVALDNAGNEKRLEETISIRHSTPVALGPGSVDLESGDFALGTTDVSMGSGLSLTRDYSSRDLTAGSEGPLGPQWSLSVGQTESLTELVDGGVLLTSANGRQTIFAALGEGKFESPTGDSNLTLELEENKTTKEKIAYRLKNAAAGTAVKFTEYTGMPVWVPAEQEGKTATDTVIYKYKVTSPVREYELAAKSNPTGIANGPDGNLWFTDEGTNKIGKITTNGVVTEYGLPAGSQPYGIVAGPDGNLWFTEHGTSKIGKITTAGVVTEYGLTSGLAPNEIAEGPDKNLWFAAATGVGKITTGGVITYYNTSSVDFGITAGSDGNVWFTSPSGNWVGRVNISSGGVEKVLQLASGEPHGITTGPGGKMWFTLSGGSKIDSTTSMGELKEYSLPANSYPDYISKDTEGNLWFTDHNSSKLGEMSILGVFSEYSLPAGSGPAGITGRSDGNLWFVNRETNKIGHTYKEGPLIEPTEILAPVPSGVSCPSELKELSELKAGCRSLKFVYGTNTVAKEAASEWGEYDRRLMRVVIDMWDPVSKKPAEKTIAEYSYDARGRLRAEWDPRISPALKTTYGYDEEGHVTALTPPGEESWSFTYGSVAGDSGAGRLIKVNDAPASSELWGGKLPEKFSNPSISGSTVVGTRLNTSTGIWLGSPASNTITYGYQWQDCDSLGNSCTAILGATNPNYTVMPSDVGHTLRSQVTATNGGGTLIATSSASAVVNTALVNEYAVPSGSGPVWITSGPDEKLWFTDYLSSKIGKITTAGVTTEYALPAGSEPFGITTGPDGNLWFTDLGTSKIGKITTAGVITETALPAGSAPYGITSGPDGKLWFADLGTSKIGKITTTGAITEYALPSGSGPFGITTGPDSNLWFTEYASSRVGKITTSGTITEYPIAPSSAPRGIVSGPDGNLWFANLGTSKAGNLLPSWKGPYADSSSSGYQLTPNGGITYPSPGPTPDGASVALDGSSGYLASANTAAGNTTGAPGVTLEAWIKPNNVADGTYQEIISKTFVAQFDIPAGSNHVRALFGNGSSWIASAEGGALAAGQWAHVAATYDGSVAHIYINGSLVATGTVATGAFGSYAYPLVIGANDYAGPTIGSYFWGSISDAAVYKQAMTLTQVEVDYKASSEAAYESQVLARNPAAYYSFTSHIGEVNLLASSEPYGITTGPDNNIWTANHSTNKIAKITLKPANAAVVAPEPGFTIDYNVPLEGSGAPAQMGVNPETHKAEPEKWGQKEEEDPVEATSITPPDSPQGWPASGYTRATTYYLDEQGRLVNVESPSKASQSSISTTEYNEENDPVRILSPDNRITALEAGSKSIEVAKLLATYNTYRSMCSRESENNHERESAEFGTRLCETEGPQRMVRYMVGKEQKEELARDHTKYFYDENVPAGEPYGKETYNLLTETRSYAELSATGPGNGEEVEGRIAKTSYSGQNNLGWRLRAPTSVTTDPNGLKLTTTTEYNEASGQAIETRGAAAAGTFTFASKFGEAGSEPGKLKNPFSLAIDSKGDLWVVDEANNRIEEFGPEGKYLSTFGKLGTAPGELKEPKGLRIDSKGNLWVAESGNNRIQEFGPEGKSLLVFGKAGSEPGELKEPKSLALDAKGNVWVADTGNNRIQEFGPEGKLLAHFGKSGTGPGELKEPKGMAVDSKGNVWVADTGNNRIQEFGPEGKLLAHFGQAGAGSGDLKTPFGLAFDSSGNLWVADGANSRVEAFSPAGAYITQFGWKGKEAGQLNEPRDVAIDAQGNMWVSDLSNNRLEEFSKGANAHDSKIVYYSSGANTEEGYGACGLHPEWAGLVCETSSAKQPELASLPKLPATQTTYNMWDEPEETIETFGSAPGAKTRTKLQAYDGAGRLATSETTSTATGDSALPKVTLTYTKETGEVEKKSTPEQSITSEYDRLGRITKYTDADGNTATYKYANSENDNLIEEISDSSSEGKSKQTYSYDPTTKLVSKIVDSGAGTFTASYDAEGQLVSEIYPNGMCADYTHNSVNEAVGVQYLKTNNCAESEPAVWYKETRVPSVHGETLRKTSTLGNDTYNYDQVGRLTETQEESVEEGCTTRTYTFDEESNRTSLITRNPNSKGECQTEGGQIESHNYDEANRLTDAEIKYDELGNITKLPATDAEGHELVSAFYIDGAVANQTQNGQTNAYSLDPEGRVRKTTSTGTTTSTVKAHYDGAGEAVAWTEEEITKKWTRNIPGIDGALAATEAQGETAILQLHDLEGDTVATIVDKAGETELHTKYNSTEFGVPNHGKEPPKFAWLGAGDIERSLPSGVITYGATSYVPQTGMALQTEQVDPPGNAVAVGGGAPATFREEPWVLQGAGREAAEAPGIGAGEGREAAEAACRAAPESCSEDPAWSGDVSIVAAEAISGALEGIEIAYYVDGDGLAKEVLEIVAEHLNVNFLSQLKEVVQKGLFGYSLDEVAQWAFATGNLLQTCAESARKGGSKPKKPHCWLYIDTTVRYAYKGGPRIGEIPNFAVTPTIGYCPWGKYSECLIVNDW